MVFVVIATMVKEKSSGNHVRASSLVVLNASSEAEAKGQFVSSPDVTEHMQDGWRVGPVSAFHVTPESVLSDVDTLEYAKAKLVKGEGGE